MKSSVVSLLTSAALITTAVADSASTWLQWSSSSTPAPAPAPAPVTWTDWVTTVETVYKTVDNYITVTYTPPPATVTVTKTDVSVSVSGSVATIVNTVTVTPAPVTVYATSVAVSVSVSESVGTVVDTVVNTVTDTVTITSISRSVSTTTESALNGLVTCPPRITNPTYTPPAPLPSTYLWGCPPGKLCHPKREGCNFEQDLPSGTYVCAPEECMPVADLPPIELYLNYENISDTCASFVPIDDYFNINPLKFGLNFGIFDIYGQPTCSPIDTVYVTVPTTVVQATTVVEATTVDVPVPTTVVEYSNVPTTLVQYSNIPTTVVEYSNVPVPTTIVQVITQTLTIAPVYSSSSTWAAWNSKVTKRADLAERALEKRILAGTQCYVLCDRAAAAWMSVGNDPNVLCPRNGAWATAIGLVSSCTSKYGMTGIYTVETQLNTPVSICRGYSQKRSVRDAFRFAR